jgi:hypothetical protein
MGIFKKLFGSNHQEQNVTDPEVYKLVDKASHIADEIINRVLVGGRIMTTSTVEMGSETPLTKAIDRVLELEPNNPDFLFAKAEAHYARMDGETGMEFRKKTLQVDPNHFDANMLTNHYENWDHLFSYCGWREQTITLPDMMFNLLSTRGELVQIVRDGLKLSIAVLVPTTQMQIPADEIAESKWIPLWIDTPHGPLFVHYSLFKLKSGEIFRSEGCTSVYPITPIHQRTGYWLIRRFCELKSIFVCYVNGNEVLYNRRYDFPKTLSAKLIKIKEKLSNIELPPDYDTKFKLSAQWYMNNSNLDDIKW